jgi:hypothetical protein
MSRRDRRRGQPAPARLCDRDNQTGNAPDQENCSIPWRATSLRERPPAPRSPTAPPDRPEHQAWQDHEGPQQFRMSESQRAVSTSRSWALVATAVLMVRLLAAAVCRRTSRLGELYHRPDRTTSRSLLAPAALDPSKDSLNRGDVDRLCQVEVESGFPRLPLVVLISPSGEGHEHGTRERRFPS